MLLRGSLFIRTFVAFWLMTLVILGSWLLVANYFESQPPGIGLNAKGAAGPPHRFMLRTLYDLENLDDAALASTVAKIRRQHDIRIYLVNRDGTELLGVTVPPAVSRVADQLHERRRIAFIRAPRQHLTAHRIFRPDATEVSAVFVFPSHRGFMMKTLVGNPSLRFVLAVLVSGVACFGLSRLITNRIKALQSASRRLANGELDTRLQVRERGGDETDELARDFNTMAAQLQERMQVQKRLLGDVSHELRSPLTRLRIAVALAQEKPGQGPEYLQRIEQEAERLEELIGQLLSSHEHDIRLDTHVDLVALLQQLCADANFEGHAAGKQFRFSTATQQALVDSSADLLHKSFDNILRNALQHTPENSLVSIALTVTEGGYQVAIEDQGPGVPENALEDIFTEFYRVDNARTRESGGYGLGLSIARRAIRQHGGDVTANNTGSGLRVTVCLPAQRE